MIIKEWLFAQLDNATPTKDSKALWKHFSKTYLSMRVVLFTLAFTMPFVLTLYGNIRHGLDFQPSMSAYFWAATQDQCATFPMRTIFVGYLFAVGVFMFGYKGLTGLENSLLNGAALCAFTIAIYPENLDPESVDPRTVQLFESCDAVQAWAELPSMPIHLIAAIILFLLLAIVAVFCADKSLKYLPTDKNPDFYRWLYRIIGGLMIVFPIIGYAVAYLLNALPDKVFYIEAAGVLTFGLYWAVKTRELSLSSLEKDPVKAVHFEEQRLSFEEQLKEKKDAQ
jgi:hypothetical protein